MVLRRNGTAFCAGAARSVCMRRMPPAAIAFLSWQKSVFNPAFFPAWERKRRWRAKERMAKGDLRRNKLHIPHPVRRLRRIGLVRSVVPPFPTRIASLDPRGSLAPFAIPLKRPRRGLRPPSLDHPRGLACAEAFLSLQNAMQMRIRKTGEVIEILCGKVGRTEASAPTSLLILETLRIPYVKYSTGANKTTRTAHRALGKPDSKAARRAFGLRTE